MIPPLPDRAVAPLVGSTHLPSLPPSRMSSPPHRPQWMTLAMIVLKGRKLFLRRVILMLPIKMWVRRAVELKWTVTLPLSYLLGMKKLALH